MAPVPAPVCGDRKPKNIIKTPESRRMPPAQSRPSATQPRKFTLTPRPRSAATPADASAFITTIDQVPSLAGQVSETFVPVVCAVQNGCAAGGPVGGPPGLVR